MLLNYFSGGTMLQHLSREKVYQIILLARKANPPSQHDGKIVSAWDLRDQLFKTTPEEKALEDFIAGLSNEEVDELAALMWLGRGASGEEASDWGGLVKDARSHMDPSMREYITSKAPLAEYLRDGLHKLGIY